MTLENVGFASCICANCRRAGNNHALLAIDDKGEPTWPRTAAVERIVAELPPEVAGRLTTGDAINHLIRIIEHVNAG